MYPSRCIQVGMASLFCILFVLGFVQGHAVRFAGNFQQAVDLPNVTYSGYLPVSEDGKNALFYAFYEALEPAKADDLPILLWLEVRSILFCACCPVPSTIQIPLQVLQSLP